MRVHGRKLLILAVAFGLGTQRVVSICGKPFGLLEAPGATEYGGAGQGTVDWKDTQFNSEAYDDFRYYDADGNGFIGVGEVKSVVTRGQDAPFRQGRQ